jgi:hypothetical protein
VPFLAPPLRLCTDNAAMIAWAGIERLRAGLSPTTRISSPGRAGRWMIARRRCWVGQEGGQGMIGIVGAGAFGTRLAVALGQGRARGPALGARPGAGAPDARDPRNEAALAGVDLPENVSIHAEIDEICGGKALLLAMPMQALGRRLLDAWPQIDGRQPLVACCKGVDLDTLRGPSR